MLPFHLNLAPKRGTRRNSSIKNQANHLAATEHTLHPFHDGGPLQRAIQADLQSLYETLFEACIKVSGAVVVSKSSTHWPRGFAFKVFRDTFSSGKLALLHTRLSPPKSDANAYSQLLYASCLALLRNSFRKETLSEYSVVDKGAYALFLLYAFFETSPLPRAPTNATEQIATLPMGLFHAENSRLLYRKSFRQNIRIDQEHYGYLMRLRDLALAVTARCEQGRMKQRQNCLQTSDDKSASSSSSRDVDDSWACECCLATDVPSIIARLVPNLEFCSYTGPCGLQGLAGHPQYSFPVSQEAHEWLQVSRQDQTSIDDEELQDDASSPDLGEPFLFDKDLEEQLHNYLTSKKAIRIPTESRQCRRVREALLPIFTNPQGGEDHLAELFAQCQQRSDPVQQQHLHQQQQQQQPRPLSRKRLKVRHAASAFGAVILSGASVAPRSVQSLEKQKTMNWDEEQDVGVQRAGDETVVDLILPCDLTPGLEASLKVAIATLLERDESLSLPLEVLQNMNGKPADAGDISTLGGRGVSVTSTATGVGRNALKALLVKATEACADRDRSIASTSTTTGEGRNALKDLLAAADAGYAENDEAYLKQMGGLERSQGHAFLGSYSFDDNAPETQGTTEQGKVAYMSELSSDDEVQSVTKSTIGIAALRELLMTAEHHKGQRQATKNEKGKRKRYVKAKSAKKSEPVSNVSRQRTAVAAIRATELESSSSESEDQSQSDSSSAAYGRAALKELLQKALSK